MGWMGLVIIGHRSSKKQKLWNLMKKNQFVKWRFVCYEIPNDFTSFAHNLITSTTLAEHNFSSFFDIFPQQKISILRVQEDWVTKKIWWLKMNYFNLKKYLHEKSEKEKIEWNCAVHPFPLLLLSSNDQRASWVQSQRWVNLCSYSSAEVWSIF